MTSEEKRWFCEQRLQIPAEKEYVYQNFVKFAELEGLKPLAILQAVVDIRTGRIQRSGLLMPLRLWSTAIDLLDMTK